MSNGHTNQVNRMQSCYFRNVTEVPTLIELFSVFARILRKIACLVLLESRGQYREASEESTMTL